MSGSASHHGAEPARQRLDHPEGAGYIQASNPFDRICAGRSIPHRLTRPYRPQTNGLVERFNRRIVEAIGRQPKCGIAHRLFISHEDRNAFLNRFVADYNRTRLKCLGYLAPIQALTNPPGTEHLRGGKPFPKAGVHPRSGRAQAFSGSC